MNNKNKNNNNKNNNNSNNNKTTNANVRVINFINYITNSMSNYKQIKRKPTQVKFDNNSHILTRQNAFKINDRKCYNVKIVII